MLFHHEKSWIKEEFSLTQPMANLQKLLGIPLNLVAKIKFQLFILGFEMSKYLGDITCWLHDPSNHLGGNFASESTRKFLWGNGIWDTFTGLFWPASFRSDLRNVRRNQKQRPDSRAETNYGMFRRNVSGERPLSASFHDDPRWSQWSLQKRNMFFHQWVSRVSFGTFAWTCHWNFWKSMGLCRSTCLFFKLSMGSIYS